MSDLSRTVEIIFAGVDNMSGTLNSISGKLDKFGNGLQDFSEPFTNAAEAVLALDAAIAGIAIAGITMSGNIESESQKMKKSLGLPTEEAKRFREVALEVYTGGFGEDMAASFEAVTLAQKKFGDNAEVDIGKVTEQAFSLQKTFGVDMNESLGAVSTLMTKFGLTSEEAMDFIVTGFQDGLDGSGDFLESVNEYSTQFSNGGADAGQFFSVLKTGFSEGMLGTDKAADLFKEFRVRIQDDSKTTSDALKSIGIDPVEFAANMASGKMTAIEAFDIIQGKLNETGDKTVQFNAGVALMGTQFEDLGTTSALAINTTTSKIGEMQGAIDGISVKDFEQKMSSALRTVTTEFGDMTQWSQAREKIAEVFTDIAASFGPAMENVDFSGLENAVGEVWTKIQNIFVENDLDLTTVDGMENAIQLVVDGLEGLADVTSGMVDIFGPIFSTMVDLAEGFNDLSPEIKTFAGQVLGVGTALGVLGGVLVAGGSLVSGLGTLVGIFSSGGALATGVGFVLSLLTGPVGLAVALGALGLAVAGVSFANIASEGDDARKAIEEQSKKVKELTDRIKELPTDVSTVEIWAKIESGDLESAKVMIDDLVQEQHLVDIKTKAEKEDLDRYLDDLAKLPEEKKVAILAAINAGDFDTVEKLLDDIPDEKQIEIKAEPKGIEQAKEELSWFDEEGKEHIIFVNAETSGIDKAKKEIEEIPHEKLLEIKLQGDIDTQIAQITAQAETVQTAMEWTAKVDIAQAEAAAQEIMAAFDAASQTVESTSTAASSMFDSLASNMSDLSTGDKWKMQDVLDDQMDMQQQALDMQKELTTAQVEYMNARTEALEGGESLITIDSSGLEPALEMIMWQVIEKVQLKATESAADFLLGI